MSTHAFVYAYLSTYTFVCTYAPARTSTYTRACYTNTYLTLLMLHIYIFASSHYIYTYLHLCAERYGTHQMHVSSLMRQAFDLQPIVVHKNANMYICNMKR